MARPQISDDITQVVKEIHREQTGSSPSSFEEALGTVVQLANQSLGDEGWYPGKYAGKAFERVLGGSNSDTGRQSRPLRRSEQVSRRPAVEPDWQAVFKQDLEDDYTVTIPRAERQALGLNPGDLLQVIAYPAGGPDTEEGNDE